MPLRGQRKILTKRKRSKSAPPVLQSPVKRIKRKQWTNEQMEKALKKVESGETSINQAAKDHGVPRTTLKDRVSGRVEHRTNPGPRRYLNETEEREFADFLIQSSSVGYGKSRKDVMNIAEAVAKEKGLLRKSKITQGWWREFLKRQDDLSLRRGDNTAHVRMDAVNKDTVAYYFDLLKKTLEENGLINSPERIYNVDETGVPLDPKAPNVVAKKGTKKVRYRSTGKKNQITVVACGSATGQIIPPTVIFESKRVNNAWTSSRLPGMTYGCSDSGWITTELFESWLCDHFLKHAVSERPLLLLLDGHSTHYQLEVIRYARQQKVLMLCLPPHTTHESQPLDCTVFSPFKTQWRTVCHEFLQANPGKVITNFNFVRLFTKAWTQAVTPANLVAGFKSCGVYPLDSSAIQVLLSEGNEGSSACQVQQSRGSLNDEHSGDTAIQDLSSQINDSSAIQVLETESCTGNQSSVAHFDNDGSDFTAEQEELYKKRYEEGYDLFIDADYVRWIKIHHPDTSLPTDSALVCDFFSDIIPASPLGNLENPLLNTPSQLVFNQSSSITEVEQLTSLMHPGILTSPLGRVPGTVTQSLNINTENVIDTSSPVAGTLTQSLNAEHAIITSSPVAGTVSQSLNAEHVIVTSSPVAGTVTQSLNAEHVIATSSPVAGTATQSPNAEHVIVTSSPVAGTVTQSLNAEHAIITSSPVAGTVSQSLNAEHVIVTSSPVAGTVTQNVTTTLATPTTSVSPLASYLVHPVQNTTPTAPKRSIPRARLLTSDESLALLEEKENAKKMALLEKEKRKIERAEKKKKREEALQQRKEERARKAEEKARLQQEKAKKQPTRGRGRKKSKVTDDGTTSVAAVATTSVTAVTTTTAVTVSTTVTTVTSIPSISTIPSTTYCEPTQSNNSEPSEMIDPNKCCMCFVTYEDDVLDGAGAEWISCKCGRWLHEDCVEDIVKDSTGDERYCSFCIDKYTI